MKRFLGLIAAGLVSQMATGCASSGSTLVRPDQGDRQVIYRISEAQAFTTALEAYAVLYLKQSVDDIQLMRDKGLITGDEYQAKPRQILDQL